MLKEGNIRGQTEDKLQSFTKEIDWIGPDSHIYPTSAFKRAILNLSEQMFYVKTLLKSQYHALKGRLFALFVSTFCNYFLHVAKITIV